MDSLIDNLDESPPQTVGKPLHEPAGKAQAGLLAYLAILATGYTFYFARDIFIPLFLAVLLKLLLAPVMRLFQRMHIPQTIAALMTVVLLVGGVGGVVYTVEAPAEKWVSRIPKELPKMRNRLKDVLNPIQQMQQATRKVEEVTQSTQPPSTTTVVVKEPGLSEYLFSGTRNFLTVTATILLLLFALLASGDHFLRRVVEGLPRFSDKKHAVEVARTVEHDISLYLVAITAINIVMGGLCTLVAWKAGLPDPLLWGVLAGLLNYIPYLGALTTVAILSFVSLMTFPNLSDAAIAPTIYAACTLIEGNLLTPLLLSHRLQINAVCVFVGLMVFAFIWGIPGMLLAVPILAMVRVICDHVEPLTPIGRLLGDGRATPAELFQQSLAQKG